MELSLTQPVIDHAQGVHAQASAWEAAEMPIFIFLALACAIAGIWAIRAHARDRRDATAHGEARDRRLNELTRASDERLRMALRAELERTRTLHDRSSKEHWSRLIDEVNVGFGRLEQHLAGIEAQLAGAHERTSLQFNEAMVVIEQAGLAATRLHTRLQQ